MSAGEVLYPVIWGNWIGAEAGFRSRLVHSNSLQSISPAADIFTADYRVHKRLLLGSDGDSAGLRPSAYVRVSTYEQAVSTSSSSSTQALAESFYDRANDTLTSLRGATDEDGDAVVERGAIDTAVSILDQLKTLEYCPPELSWHGGDAVVMLWTNTNTTFAITVTDGEWGYVARRDGKQIKLAHSIKLSQLALEDLH